VTWPVQLDPRRINLHVEERISAEDASRQMATAAEILRRLEGQPGLVLADEVGMGKTFVALAVAVSAIWADRGRNPVVVMVPPSLKDKWPTDFATFVRLCVKQEEERAKLKARQAWSGLDFFRVFDDPLSRRPSIVFLTHGAFHRNLSDPWVKLDILKFAMRGAHLGARRDALPRFAPSLLRVKSRSGQELFEQLFRSEPDRWRELLTRYDEDPGDDPVPEAIHKVLERGSADLSALKEQLGLLPIRESAYIEDRLKGARQALNEAMQEIWRRALIEARFRSPLLVLDEAHHLKNPSTKLASLFVVDEADEDARVLTGALSNGFERMLFLTATPFQLGHGELLNVLDRFEAIDWRSAPEGMTREAFAGARERLCKALDAAQLAATELDREWGRLSSKDLVAAQGEALDVEGWWRRVQAHPDEQAPRVQLVLRAFARAKMALGAAQEALRPWVIRHMRPRVLEASEGLRRRVRLTGSAIRSGHQEESAGLPIEDSSLLPFLLAARCQSMVARAAKRTGQASRATFAEGLASSYEAFLETRQHDGTEDGASDLLDDDVPPSGTQEQDTVFDRYLRKLHEALPGESEYAQHPKVLALTERVKELWTCGEKVVVFCHFRATGRALTKHLSRTLEAELRRLAAEKLGVDEKKAMEVLRRRGEAFHDEARPVRRALDAVLEELLAAAPGLAAEEKARMSDVVRRFVRTPLFLARYVDLRDEDEPDALRRALTIPDGSGASLNEKLKYFVHFIGMRCQPEERAGYLEALESIQSGTRLQRDEEGSEAMLLPAVRRADGGVGPETRRNLLLAFNTPFFPEVLVASSVLAEGVDLHLYCRYLIHHDLSWNPSTIEQRTGRVDRIGAKAERVKQSINVFMPFVAGTQDEKMYRVVCDRERWFQVVMGEKYQTDEFATDRGAERVPLPLAAAEQLVMRLEVDGGTEPQQAGKQLGA
jgi:hypothetical protein